MSNPCTRFVHHYLWSKARGTRNELLRSSRCSDNSDNAAWGTSGDVG